MLVRSGIEFGLYYEWVSIYTLTEWEVDNWVGAIDDNNLSCVKYRSLVGKISYLSSGYSINTADTILQYKLKDDA